MFALVEKGQVCVDTRYPQVHIHGIMKNILILAMFIILKMLKVHTYLKAQSACDLV